MSEDLHQQIYNNLNLLETEDLLEIWRKHDLSEYTEEALSIVQQILHQRLSEVPLS